MNNSEHSIASDVACGPGVSNYGGNSTPMSLQDRLPLVERLGVIADL